MTGQKILVALEAAVSFADWQSRADAYKEARDELAKVRALVEAVRKTLTAEFGAPDPRMTLSGTYWKELGEAYAALEVRK